MRPLTRFVFVVALALLCGAAKPKKSKKKPPPPPPGPAWVQQPPRYSHDAQGRAFVATGRTEDPKHPEAAEDDARQKLAQLVATWQEKTLACAKQASETQVSTRSEHDKGAAIDVVVETATAVSLYDEKVADHAAVGTSSLVLMRQELPAMLHGIAIDDGRPAALREAAKTCGEQSFDALAGS